MDISRLIRKSAYEWWIEPRGSMHAPGVFFADEQLIRFRAVRTAVRSRRLEKELSRFMQGTCLYQYRWRAFVQGDPG